MLLAVFKVKYPFPFVNLFFSSICISETEMRMLFILKPRYGFQTVLKFLLSDLKKYDSFHFRMN